MVMEKDKGIVTLKSEKNSEVWALKDQFELRNIIKYVSGTFNL
jgi:hypothetical protein